MAAQMFLSLISAEASRLSADNHQWKMEWIMRKPAQSKGVKPSVKNRYTFLKTCYNQFGSPAFYISKRFPTLNKMHKKILISFAICLILAGLSFAQSITEVF